MEHSLQASEHGIRFSYLFDNHVLAVVEYFSGYNIYFPSTPFCHLDFHATTENFFTSFLPFNATQAKEHFHRTSEIQSSIQYNTFTVLE